MLLRHRTFTACYHGRHDGRRERYAAAWLVGLGPVLGERIHDADGRGLMPDERTDLRTLSTMAGGWWDWPEDAHEPQFFTLDQWNARYRAIREGAA